MRQGYFRPVSAGHASTGKTTRSCSPSQRRGSTGTWRRSSATTAARWRATATRRTRASPAKRAGVRHAQCWSHARRGFERARDGEPAAAAALSLIGALYANEKTVRTRKLKGGAKLAHRRKRSAPVVERFSAWCRER